MESVDVVIKVLLIELKLTAVDFASDKSSPFYFRFVSVCGGPVTLVGDSVGVIASPLYPLSYPVHSHCIWTITVDVDRVIEVRFTEMMIPSRDAGGQCGQDYVSVSNVPLSYVYRHLIYPKCKSNNVYTYRTTF